MAGVEAASKLPQVVGQIHVLKVVGPQSPGLLLADIHGHVAFPSVAPWFIKLARRGC